MPLDRSLSERGRLLCCYFAGLFYYKSGVKKYGLNHLLCTNHWLLSLQVFFKVCIKSLLYALVVNFFFQIRHAHPKSFILTIDWMEKWLQLQVCKGRSLKTNYKLQDRLYQVVSTGKSDVLFVKSIISLVYKLQNILFAEK